MREIEDATAGLRIRGTAREPRVEVFSIPAMAEADALAYLVTGKPLDALARTARRSDLVTLRYRLSEAFAVRVVRGPAETRAGLEIRIER